MDFVGFEWEQKTVNDESKWKQQTILSGLRFIYAQPFLFSPPQRQLNQAHSILWIACMLPAQSDSVAKREMNIVYTIHTIGAATAIVAGFIRSCETNVRRIWMDEWNDLLLFPQRFATSLKMFGYLFGIFDWMARNAVKIVDNRIKQNSSKYDFDTRGASNNRAPSM